MRVKNDFGNRYTGTLGKQITASTWKGRNYVKKYTKPANPDTINQQRVRGHFAAAVALWKTFTPPDKHAYGDKTRSDKTNISPFNTMVSSYVKIRETGEAYEGPIGGHIEIQESVTGTPIEGARLTIRKAGQSTVYQERLTVETGIASGSLCVEDQNYDLTVSAEGFITRSITDLDAESLWRGTSLIKLVLEE